MKKYIEVRENPGKITHLKVETFYSLGGMNHFTSKQERRGYYLSVTPVERNFMGNYFAERYVAFTGIKDLILEVKRKSAKAEEKADSLAEDMEQRLVDYVCQKNGIEIATN